MNKKVIIAIYDFLPFFPSFGGVARAFYLYKILKKNNFDVKIVAAKGSFYGYFGLESELDKADIYYVESRANLTKKAVSSKERGSNFFKVFIRKVYDLLIIPDYSIFDLLSFRKVIKEINSKSDFDIIISTPKHGLSLLVFLFGDCFNRGKVILDYRDSWNTTSIFKKKFFLSNYVSRILERNVLSKIDYFTYVSPIVPNLISSELGIDLNSKSMLIYNGYEPLPFPYSICPDSKKSLIYFGSASDDENSYRCVKNLIKIVSSTNGARLDFYGELSLSELDLKYYAGVEYKGTVATTELYKFVKNYAWSVILHTDKESGREVIPGKFYDCLKFGIPILCICPVESQVSKMVSKLGVGVVVDPSKLTKALLDSILSDDMLFDKISKNYKESDFSYFTREFQLSKFLTILRPDCECL